MSRLRRAIGVMQAPLVAAAMAVAVNLATGGSIAWPLGVRDGVVWGLVSVLVVLSTLLAASELRRSPTSYVVVQSAVGRAVGIEAAVFDEAGGLDSSLPRDNLPLEVDPFVGRAEDLEKILGAVKRSAEGRGASLVVVSGMPGVGKSRLASRVAHELRSRFPYGRVHIELNTFGAAPLSTDDALVEILDVLGASDPSLRSTRARAARLRRVCAEQSVLLVLDDAGRQHDLGSLSPGGDSCAVIVTSRLRLADAEATCPLHLGVLDRVASIAMVRNAAHRDDLVDAGADLDVLARLCGDLPLALKICGALLRRNQGWHPADLNRHLRDEQRRLDVLAVPDLEVRASFELSYRRLTPTAAAMFRRLGLLDVGSIPADVAIAVSATNEQTATTALNELVDAGLIDAVDAERYALHDLLRIFARERATDEELPADRTSAVHRALDVYVDRSVRHAVLLDPVGSQAVVEMLALPPPRPQQLAPPTAATDPLRPTPLSADGGSVELATIDDARKWFGREHPTVATIVAQAEAVGHLRAAVALAAAARPYLENSGRLADLLASFEIADQAAAQVDGRAQGVARAGLGSALQRSNDYARSVPVLRDAIRLCESTGNTVDAGRSCVLLGDAYREQGLLSDAESAYRKAVVLFGQAGLAVDAAAAIGNVGMCLHQRGKLAEAAADMQRALAEILASPPSLKTIRMAAWTLENLGAVRKWQLRIGDAFACHLESLRLFIDIDDELGQGYALRNIGDLAFIHGQPDAALRCYQAARGRVADAANRDPYIQATVSVATVHASRLRLIRAHRTMKALAVTTTWPRALQLTRQHWQRLTAARLLVRLRPPELDQLPEPTGPTGTTADP